MKFTLVILAASVGLLGLFTVFGCAEGPFWRLGRYTPWVRQKWEAEELHADTLFEKKRRMVDIVNSAKPGTLQTHDEAARQIGELFQTDPILLSRLHAVKMLGELDCPESHRVLTMASKDPDAEIRLAAIQSWRTMSDRAAVPALREILGSDTNVDVRLSATRALGDFPGEQTADALRLALADPDPAIQLRATESLERATGEQLGKNVVAWRQFFERSDPQQADSTAGPDASTMIR